MAIFKKDILRRFISIIVVAAIFYFLIRNLYVNYERLSEYRFEGVYYRLFVSFALLLPVFVFNPLAWMRILRNMKENIDFRKAFAILYLSQLAKYLPGKVWSTLGQVYLAEKEGISGGKALFSSVLFQIISCASGVCVFVISLLFWNRISLFLKLSIFGSFLVFSLVLLRLGALDRMIDLVLNKLFKKNIIVHLGTKTVINIFSILMLRWMAYGVAYYHFVKSFYPIDAITAINFTGIYAISWLIGYVSLLTPGGLGIREGIQVYLLNMFIPLPISIVISLACRIWLTAGEITVALISLLFMMKQHRDYNPQHEYPQIHRL